MLKTPAYIVVEGVIGVGKTTLATMLANRLQGTLIKEEVEENPFLARFYRDQEGFRFQTQMYFLLSRFRQQGDLAEPDLFSQYVVSDYLFAKDRIFACLNLDDDELALYDRVHKALQEQIPGPDLVIHLQANTDRLMSRIAKRDREFERSIDRDYIHRLNEAYNYFFFHYEGGPLLVVNTDDIDFVANESHFEDLVKETLEGASGTRYYVPSAEGLRSGGRSKPAEGGASKEETAP